MSQWHIETNIPLVQHCHKVACLWLHLSNITWLCSSSSISNIFCQSNFTAVAEIALQQSCYCMTWSETWVHPVSKTHWATRWSQLLLECASSSASSQSVRCPSNPSSLLTFPDFLLMLLRFQFKVCFIHCNNCNCCCRSSTAQFQWYCRSACRREWNNFRFLTHCRGKMWRGMQGWKSWSKSAVNSRQTARLLWQ